LRANWPTWLHRQEVSIFPIHVRPLMQNTANKVPLGELIDRIESGDIDASAVARWLHGPGDDGDFDLDFDFEVVIEDGDAGDDGDDQDQVLDPRDFIEDFNRHRPQVDVDVDAEAIERQIHEQLRQQLGRHPDRADACGDDDHSERIRRHAERVRRPAERLAATPSAPGRASPSASPAAGLAPCSAGSG
jgi:hypothetical protein